MAVVSQPAALRRRVFVRGIVLFHSLAVGQRTRKDGCRFLFGRRNCEHTKANIGAFAKALELLENGKWQRTVFIFNLRIFHFHVCPNRHVLTQLISSRTQS